jgi:hypothetical protein
VRRESAGQREPETAGASIVMVSAMASAGAAAYLFIGRPREPRGPPSGLRWNGFMGSVPECLPGDRTAGGRFARALE